jgi:hypothetical protein
MPSVHCQIAFHAGSRYAGMNGQDSDQITGFNLIHQVFVDSDDPVFLGEGFYKAIFFRE